MECPFTASGGILISPAVEKSMTASWQVWALLSAIFAALTAIFAKIGVENVNSDFATFIRTIVILVVLAGILFSLGEFQPLGTISGRTYIFLVLSGLATDVDAAVGALCTGSGADFSGLSVACPAVAGTAAPGGTERCYDVKP
jgi:uncharacterized membrane protein